MPSLVENGTLVLEKKIFFNFLNVFSLFPNYLPLKKGGALNPLHPRMLLAKFGCFGPVVLEKKMKMWKVYDNNNDNNNEGHWTNFDQKSSLEPSAQVS